MPPATPLKIGDYVTFQTNGKGKFNTRTGHIRRFLRPDGGRGKMRRAVVVCDGREYRPPASGCVRVEKEESER